MCPALKRLTRERRGLEGGYAAPSPQTDPEQRPHPLEGRPGPSEGDSSLDALLRGGEPRDALFIGAGAGQAESWTEGRFVGRPGMGL